MLSVVNLSPSSSVRRSPPTLSLPSPAALASKDWQGVTDKVVLNTEDILNTVEERQDKVGVALLLFKSAHGIFQQDGAYVKKNLKAVFFRNSQFSFSEEVPDSGPVLASRILSLSVGQPNANRSSILMRGGQGVKVTLEQELSSVGMDGGRTPTCVHWSNTHNNWYAARKLS